MFRRALLRWRENPGDFDGDTPLHFAAASGQDHLLIKSLTVSCNVNSRNKIGWTPLMQAVRNGHTICVQILLDCGADISIRNNYGVCPISLAIASSNLETVSLVLKTWFEKKLKICEHISPSIFAVLFNNIEAICCLNKYNFNFVENIELGGLSPVIIANILRQKEILTFFKSLGVMAVNIESPSLHLNINSHSTPPPAGNETANLLEIPTLTVNSSINSTFETPGSYKSFELYPTPIKVRKSSNFCRSPNFGFSPLTESSFVNNNSSFISSNSPFSNSMSPSNSVKSSLNTRFRCFSRILTFSSSSSNDSCLFQFKPSDVTTKNAKLRSISVNDDVFLSPRHEQFNIELSTFLRRYSLDSCISLFEKHEIDMEMFLTLSETDLEEIGVDFDKKDSVLDLIYQCKKMQFAKK